MQTKPDAIPAAVADNFPVILWITDVNGKCVYLNRSWYEYTGQEDNHGLEYGWLEVVHPDDAEQAAGIFSEANQNHEPFRLYYRLRNRDGTYRWCIDSGAPKFGPDGAYEGMTGCVIDIHERKLAEEAVARQEQLFRQLADAMPQMVWMARPDGSVEYFNRRWYEYTGWPDHYPPDNWGEMIHPDDVATAQRTWMEVMRSGANFEGKFRFHDPRRPGQFRWHLSRAYPVRDAGERIKRWFGTATDIDDVVRIEETLRESEARFRTVADSAPVMIWMSDTDEQCTFFSRGWLQYTGRTMEEERGAGWMAGLHPDDLERCQTIYHEYFAARREFYMEFRLRRHDGVYRWVSVSGVPRYSPEGTFLGFTGGCMDIHARRAYNEELEQRVAERTRELQEANRQLIASNNDLEQFAYVASHDLKEPVRKISMFAGMLASKIKDRIDDKSRGQLDKIAGSAERMTKLIDDLLNYSRLHRDARQLERVDLNDVLGRVLNELDLLIEQRGAHIHSVPLPTLAGIPVQLYQLFYNLIGNALKFVRPDTPPVVRITVRDLPPDELATHDLDATLRYFELVFTDNGIGFDQKYAREIFVIFKRLETQAEYAGTGIGLALCRKIALNHQGDISAESEAGRGTTFRVVLPYEQE